ncbi:MAG TPA: nuclear transport factor 2 family protein [Longimicrobiaceae bacterium]|nr:nuclear transport factor 2 family protein [Longimicrobiaceae bacterium]
MNARFASLLLCVALAACAGGRSAGDAGDTGELPPRDQETEQEVRSLEEQRFAAMVRGDTAGVGRILADDLTYTHSTGVVESRDQFLAGIAAGMFRYEAIEPEEVRVRAYGTAAVVTGRARMRVRTPAGAQAFRIRYTDVYALREGRWRMVAWQSTRIPE